MAMQVAIPKQYTVVSRWPLIVLEILLILGLLALRSGHSTASAILLDWDILSGKIANNASVPRKQRKGQCPLGLLYL